MLPVSCPSPLDLSSDVEDMDYQLESLKRTRSVSDVMPLDGCPENTSKKICIDKSRLLDENRLQQNKVVANPTSSYTMASDCEFFLNEFTCRTQVQDDISALHNSHSHQPNKRTHVMTTSEPSKVNSRSQRRITHNYAPVDNQVTTMQCNRIRPAPNITENAQRRSKRPRFTQVREQDLSIASNNIRGNTSQHRRMRQGPPSTYLSIGSCNEICKHCNAFFWYGERIKSSSQRCPQYHRCCNNDAVHT